jgi:ArsR family transcriptional regulator
MKDWVQSREIAILKALANPVRIGIVEALAERELCVCQISEKFTLDRTSVSKHLSLLKSLGILDCHKEGLHVFYSLRIKCLPDLLRCIEHIAASGNEETPFLMCSCRENDR